MTQREFDPVRRQLLESIITIAGGAMLAGCSKKATVTENVQPTEKGESSVIPPTATLEVSTPDWVAPTETRSPAEVMAEWEQNAEVIRQNLEGQDFRAKDTPVEIIKMERVDRWSEWFESEEPHEFIKMNNIDFDVVNIECRFVESEEPYFNYQGYISNMTGDPSRWKVNIGNYYPSRGEFVANAEGNWEDPLSDYPGIEESYGAMAEDTIYDNKVDNVINALVDFAESGAIGFGPGETFSYLEAIRLEEHLRDIYYYKPGYDAQYVVRSAGGVCMSGTTVIKAAHRAEKKGHVLITEGKEHSSGPYYVNREDTDTRDATVAIIDLDSGERIRLDAKILNTSDRRLYFATSVDVLIPELPEGTRLPSSMEWPASVKLMFSVTLTDRPPTPEDSESVRESLARFREFRKKYGQGRRDGFDGDL